MLGNEFSVQTSFRLSFLLQMLIRSSKFLTVMLSVFMFKSEGHSDISKEKIGMAIVFTFAIFVFHLGDAHKGAANEVMGIVLGFLSLVCDCCVSHFQTILKKKHNVSYWTFVQSNYLWCFIFALVLSFLKNEFIPAVSFLKEHPQAIYDMLRNEIIGSISLLVVFFHIHTFGSISMAKITTVRKSLSIIISIVAFGHSLNTYRLTGLILMGIVFACEAYLNVKQEKIKNKTK